MFFLSHITEGIFLKRSVYIFLWSLFHTFSSLNHLVLCVTLNVDHTPWPSAATEDVNVRGHRHHQSFTLWPLLSLNIHSSVCVAEWAEVTDALSLYGEGIWVCLITHKVHSELQPFNAWTHPIMFMSQHLVAEGCICPSVSNQAYGQIWMRPQLDLMKAEKLIMRKRQSANNFVFSSTYVFTADGLNDVKQWFPLYF